MKAIIKDFATSTRAWTQLIIGKNESARSTLRELVELRSSRLGPSHPRVIDAMLLIDETLKTLSPEVLGERLELLNDAAERLRSSEHQGFRLSRVLHLKARVLRYSNDFKGALVAAQEAEESYAYSNPLSYARCSNLWELADLYALNGDDVSCQRSRAKADGMTLVLARTTPKHHI